MNAKKRWRFWRRRLPVLVVRPGETLILDAGPRCTAEQAATIRAQAADRGVKVLVMGGLKAGGSTYRGA